MNEIKLPVLDPQLTEAAVENWLKGMQSYAEQAAEGIELFAAAFKSYCEQAAAAIAELERRGS